MRKVPKVELVLALACAASAWGAREPYSVGAATAAAGAKASGFIEVPAGVDPGTRIPVTVIHGVEAGPVLALIAGTHGVEYPPVLALQRVRRDLDPAKLSGTVILVHVANVPSFLGRTIYYTPADGKNLNRVYPGRADGSQSERIAWAITTSVIERADYVVDLHCGDGNEALRPYAYWMQSGDPALDARTKAMLLAFGLDHIVLDPDRPKDANASVFTSNTALTRGKPAITTETGRLGGSEEEFVAMAERGCWNLLRHLKMVPGEEEPSPTVVWLDHYEVLRSPVTGMFRPSVRDGWAIAEGGLLGTLTDLFGTPIGEVRAPFAGIVTYVIATPPISEGEPLAMVARVAADTPSR